MLPALGVFLRPPWPCMARTLCAREVLPHPHPTNIYGIRHGTTLSLRHTHSVVGHPESAKTPDRDSSNDQSTLHNVFGGSIPPQWSILEVIQQKLPELLPEHSPGDEIFEVRGQEYSTVISTLLCGSPNSSLHALAQLVELRDFDQAYLLLKDIQDLNIDIPLSFAYEAPAQAVLRNADLRGPTQVEQFSAWFTLIPPAYDSGGRTFDETFHLIFQAKVTNLALILAFSKIMASKGYGQMTSSQAIPFIMRYSSIEVGLNFLDDFNDASTKYWATHNPKIAAKKSEMVAINSRGLAVRSLVYSGRIDDALSLLPNPEDGHFRLTRYTYDFLLRRLEKSKNVEHRQHISLVEKLRSQESTTLFEYSVSPLTILAEEVDMASKLRSTLPVDLTENLAIDLRYMKTAFLHNDLIPHPFTIVNFMNAYLSTGRTRALELLYNRAVRTGYRVVFTFIFAEMLFYHRLRHYDLVIEAFVDHFYLTGVPREHVLNRYHRLIAKRRAFDPNTRGDPPPERCYKFDPHKALPRGKLWPLSAHCNLVYHALVALTPSGTAIESLYQELLLIVEHGKDTPFSPVIASVEPLVANSRGRPSSGAFTPFFRRLMHTFGAIRGAKVLSEMVKLGIKPTIYHYTELAGFYASRGEPQKAFLILDNLETRFKSAAQSSTTGSNDGDSSKSGTLESTVPAPDIVMYISLMRGFIISKNLQAADDVAARLKRRHKYQKGENNYLDEVYRDIEYLRKELEEQARFFL